MKMLKIMISCVDNTIWNIGNDKQYIYDWFRVIGLQCLFQEFLYNLLLGCSWPGKALALLLGCAVYYDDSFCTALYICYLQADDIRNEANELLRIRDYLYNELAKNTGQPIEKVPPFVFFIL